ncbi:hypothetical protein Aph02nite_48300 [Actinoplanes philippinensis]|nr:hypothetical protein Aph02nite_48300 [Actinoplanes philippinensis]
MDGGGLVVDGGGFSWWKAAGGSADGDRPDDRFRRAGPRRNPEEGSRDLGREVSPTPATVPV